MDGLCHFLIFRNMPDDAKNVTMGFEVFTRFTRVIESH